MNSSLLPRRLGVWLLLAMGSLMARAGDFDHSHAAWTRLLARHATNGIVHYSALKASPDALRNYLGTLAEVPETRFREWSRPQRLSFLLNLYNAATLQLIVDHHPVPSIRKIGGVLKGPWKQEIVHVWGRVLTLDTLEHGILRPEYGEPRIHFALVCAAKGCPPLRGEAYVADRLEAQLEDQARTFLSQTSKNRVDAAAGILWLSPIFDWYGGDFTAGGKSLPEFVSPFLPAVAERKSWKVKFTDYDWSLNGD